MAVKASARSALSGSSACTSSRYPLPSFAGGRSENRSAAAISSVRTVFSRCDRISRRLTVSAGRPSTYTQTVSFGAYMLLSVRQFMGVSPFARQIRQAMRASAMGNAPASVVDTLSLFMGKNNRFLTRVPYVMRITNKTRKNNPSLLFIMTMSSADPSRFRPGPHGWAT